MLMVYESSCHIVDVMLDYFQVYHMLLLLIYCRMSLDTLHSNIWPSNSDPDKKQMLPCIYHRMALHSLKILVY